MSGSGSLNGLVVGGIVLCCVMGATGYFAYQSLDNGDVYGAETEALVPIEPTASPQAAQIERPAITEPLASPAGKAPPSNDQAQRIAAASPEAQAESDVAPAIVAKVPPNVESEDVLAPIFDLVRIDQSGSGLIAGRATPDISIEIVNDGTVVGTTHVGPDGAFVAYITVDPNVAAQELIAQAVDDQTTVTAAAAPVVVVASPDEDTAPVVFQPSEQGVRLIQPAPRVDAASVTLDAISYDTNGQVTFAGRAKQAAAIRLYLNGALVLETRAADDSSWRASAGKVIAPGVYTLRVDQLDETGAVTSRIETPFLREQIVEGDLGDNQLTVQTGNNLWKLAEGIYGAGTRYTLIYQANRDSIRDPDLIYPGQIFKLPDAAPSQ